MSNNKYIIISAILLLDYCILQKRSILIDQSVNSKTVPSEVSYIFYTLFYKLALESLFVSKIINLIFNFIIISIVLFCFYKKLGLILVSLITSLILCNVYFIMSITDFWNSIILNLLINQAAKFYYLYCAFFLSFLLIMFIFIKNENKLLTNIFMFKLFMIINILQFFRYIKNYEYKLNLKNIKILISSLYKDSNEQNIEIELVYILNYSHLYKYISKTYFSDMFFLKQIIQFYINIFKMKIVKNNEVQLCH